MKKRIIVVSLILIAFFIYKKVTSDPKGITTFKVTSVSLISDFSANGKVKAKNSVDLKFITPSKISWVGVKEGDMVVKGQALARLDSVVLNSIYQSSLGNYRRYQAIADRVLDSVKDHDTDESFSQKEERTIAEVNRDNAYNDLLAAKKNLYNASLVAPFSGIVTETNDLVAGENLTGADLGSRFIRVVDPKTIYFSALVDETDYQKIKKGQEVNVNFDAFADRNCMGIVDFVGKNGTETIGGVITIPVEVKLDKCDLDLIIGLNGQARFVLTKLDNALVIPKKYIVTKNGNDFVWLKTGKTDKSRKLVAVKTGMVTSTEAEIKEGLDQDDEILFIPEK